MTRRAGAQVCAPCHPLGDPKLAAKHSGIPIATASCVGCHDPHVQETDARGLVRSAQHAPFGRRQCASCHTTEGSAATFASVPDLCFKCHDQSRAWYSKPVVHAALKSKRSCLTCHGAHAGAERPVLAQREEQLCFSCHDRKILSGKHLHPAMENGCSTCHDPHASDEPHLLKKKTADLCKDCHEDTSQHLHATTSAKVERRTGTPLTCTGCHLPHSSDEKSLLVREPTRELCVQCHDPAIAPPGN
jgi:predicted CXXCH cytochrome family protein